MPRILAVLYVIAIAVSGCGSVPVPTAYRAGFIRAGTSSRIGPLNVIDEGSGPAVVLLHGLGGSAFDFRHQRLALLEAGCRVIVPDMLGAGYSDHPAGADYRIPAQAERIVDLLDALKVDRATFVGNSYGGGTAVVIALSHPERVDRLVLLDASAIPQGFPWFLQLARIPVVGELMYTFPRKLLMRVAIGAMTHDFHRSVSEEEWDEYAHEHSFEGAASSTLGMARGLDVREGEEIERRLPSLRIPTLIVWGREDAVTPLDVGKRLSLLIPGSSLVVLPDCAHVPHMERPGEVNRLILDFLIPKTDEISRTRNFQPR